MTLLVGKILAILAALTIALTAFVAMQVQDLVVGSAPSGLASTVATSTNPTVTTGAEVIFATSTGCASRIITTGDNFVNLTFSDRIGQTPTVTFGHLQATNTTEVYDSGIYGCGLWKAFSLTSQVITTTETR